jgi:hypothetical protein
VNPLNYEATACKWVSGACVNGEAADLPKDKCNNVNAKKFFTWNESICLKCDGEMPDYVQEQLDVKPMKSGTCWKCADIKGFQCTSSVGTDGPCK